MKVQTRSVRVPGEYSLEDVARVLSAGSRAFVLSGKWNAGRAIAGSDPISSTTSSAEVLSHFEQQTATEDRPHDDESPIGGAWVGYLGYQVGGSIERLTDYPPRRVGLPKTSMSFYDHLLRQDQQGDWWFDSAASPDREGVIGRKFEKLISALQNPPRARRFKCDDVFLTPSRGEHMKSVSACLDAIGDGEIFQANLAMRAEARFEGDPLEVFLRGVGNSTPARAAYLSSPHGSIASLSPELFLERRGRSVISAPIKGTRPRVHASREQGEALLASAKDRAENLMIVDLMRNDLGRVCEVGSVTVPELFVLEAHPNVWHLTSYIRGELREGVTDAGLLRATFPPGSVTGAPKIRAMETINRLEATAREVYTGAIGFVSPARTELSVAIRTLEFAQGKVWFGIGGGIVADSDPVAEYEECLTKAGSLLGALDTKFSEQVI